MTNWKAKVTMRIKPSALLSPAASAGLLGLLPLWSIIALAALGAALAALQVIVTQIIRLRIASKIATSAHALRVLEVQACASVISQARQTSPRRRP
jgi:hypothetical protein